MSSNFGGDKDSFSITLVSSASMNIFIDNSLASFKNLLSEDIDLQGEWRVALSEITFPTHFNNVTDTKIVYYKKDKVRASLKVAKDKISRPYDGEKIELTKGEYGEIEKLFNEINRKVDLDNFTYSIDPITKHLSIWMHYWEGITFESPQIPSSLGFKGIRDGTGYHIGYKESSHIHSTLTSQNFISDYPVDISTGTQMMFIYLDIIYVCRIEPNHRKVFSNLDYKKLLVNDIQSIAVNLRTETGRLVPFAGGGGKSCFDFKISKVF